MALASPYSELSGEFFDVVPQNIIIREDGAPALIDKEWQLNDPIELGHLLFRSLLMLINSISRFSIPASGECLTRYQFIEGVFIAADVSLQKDDYVRYNIYESEIQKNITGRTAESFANWGEDQPLPMFSLNQVLSENDDQIATLKQAVIDHNQKIDTLKQAVIDRNQQIDSLKQTVVDRDAQMANLIQDIAKRDASVALVNLMKNSTSWRLTRPLRFAARLYRYGMLKEDRQRLSQAIRRRYHQLPLPSPVKTLFSFAYHKSFGKKMREFRASALRVVQFHAPSIRPAAQQQGVSDYIVWGVIDWHFRHQRPQQLALSLAKTGRRVFYVSPNFIDDERPGFEVETLDTDNLLFQIKLFVKDAPIIYSLEPGVETVSRLRASIGEVMDWADCKQVVSMVQHPFWYEAASVLLNSRLIYDCMDHHEGFGNNAESLLQLEKSILNKADLTITTSAWLDKAVEPYAKRRVLIHNACDYDHFSRAPNSSYRDPQGRRIIGYYGAIAEWFDLELVEAVAKQHSECCVLLIGADTVNAKSRLRKLSNVTFTGEVPYSKLPYYLYSFDVCLLPFKVIPLTLATNPVKAYEFLCAGKPTVAVDLPEMAQFYGLIYVATDQKKFLAAVNAILTKSEPEELIQRRKVFAAGQTWAHRGEALIRQAESSVGDPLVSVVVVTYNNLDLTRACLVSLDEHSLYENIEIIVVDNASIDGSQEFLTEWFTGARNRKLVLNDNNRGFAAANNKGLAIASGDYLVLLNNDTYVTPGWIRTLVKHLQRDTTVGLIGPVTNNIGNEAKINISYGNMEEMLQASSDYIRNHIGKTFPLRTAAFFCAMMPRTVYESVGPLDESFNIGFFEDDDYCRRIEQIGLHIVCAEDVFIHHYLSASYNKLQNNERITLFNKNKLIYEAKWGKWTPHKYRV